MVKEYHLYDIVNGPKGCLKKGTVFMRNLEHCEDCYILEVPCS